MQQNLLDFISLTGGKILRIPLAVLSASLLARAIGPEGVGQWAMILAVTHLLHSFLFSWTQSANVRFGREEWTLNNKLSDIWATRGPLIGIGIGLTAIILIAQPFSFLELFFKLSPSWWPYIFIFVLGQWFFSESQSLFRVTGKIRWLTLIPILVELTTIIFLIILFFQPSKASLNFTLSGMILLFILTSGTVWVKEFLSSKSLGGKSNWEKRKKLIRYSWPLLPGLFFSYLSNWGDHILLQYFRPPREVGFFSSSYQVMQVLFGLASSVSILFLPKLIDRKLSEPGVEKDYLTRICPTIISFWLMVLIPFLIVIPWGYKLVFGKEFLEAIPVLLLLCVAVPSSIFTAIYSILFELQERLGKATYFNGTALVLNFIVSLALVVQLGGIGVAYGTAASYFLAQILYVFDQHKYLKIPKKKILILLVSCMFCGVLQCVIGENLLLRTEAAVFCLVCLIPLIRHYNMIDKTILNNLLSGKLSTIQPFFYWLFIRKSESS